MCRSFPSKTDLLLGVIAGLLGFASPGFSQDSKQPNVLFIVADDLRADLGCYGTVATIAEHRCAGKARRSFNRAYCQQAVCNPSRSSFLTGKRPDTLHQWSNGQHFREKNPDVITLPQWFKQHGYTTRDVGKIFHNWHTKVQGRPGIVERRRVPALRQPRRRCADGRRAKYRRTLALPASAAITAKCRCAKLATSPMRPTTTAESPTRRCACMGEIKDKPFFLAVGFWKPHAPFNAPKKYWDLI